MAKYKLLKQYIYTVDDKSLPKNIIADQEYRRRIDGYSTIMTQMRPKIMNDEEASTTTYPIFFVETVRINELISKMYRHSKQIILLEDMLTILVSGQQDVIQDLRGKKEKLDTIKHNLAQQEQFSDLDKGILFIISQSQLFNIVDSTSIKDNEIVAIINKRKVAVNSIKGAIKDLTSNGILVEISKNPLKHVINKKTWHELLI